MSQFTFTNEINEFAAAMEKRARQIAVDNHTPEHILSLYDSLVASNVSASEFRAEFKKLLESPCDKIPQEVKKTHATRAINNNVGTVPRGGFKKIPGNTPLVFNTESHKRGKSGERYETYKGAKSVGEYKELNNTTTQEQQKDLEHAIVHKLVQIDSTSFGEDDSCALSWINKCIEKSTTVKEKKSPKKTKMLKEDDDISSLVKEMEDNMYANTNTHSEPLSLSAPPPQQQPQSSEEPAEEKAEEPDEEPDEEPAEEPAEEHTEQETDDDEELELEDYVSRGENFFIDRKTNKVYQQDEDEDYEVVGDINSHPEDEEE